MLETWKDIIWKQFGASLDMLESAMEACPDELWGDRTLQPEYWNIAYHALFFLDYYLSGSPKGFAPPAPFTLSELDPSGAPPDRLYSKEELLRYLEHGRGKCRRAIWSLTAAAVGRPCAFNRPGITVAGLLLYTMRHVQHHAGQMNLLLRQEIDSAPRWVSIAKSGLAD